LACDAEASFVVGGIRRTAGYYEAVTHSGVTLAAIIGRLLATEITRGAVSPFLRPYRPDRFDDPRD
jgi:glycine/D-amino acid oxidase-like deaminating enzyme